MTKDEMQKEIDVLRTLLGLAFMLIPASRTKVFFERAAQIKEGL